MSICMDPKVRYGNRNLSQRAILRGALTDRCIRLYEKLGYYTPEAIKARSEQRKKASYVRFGDFLKAEDGRLIYSPR